MYLELEVKTSLSREQWKSLEEKMEPDLRLFNEGWFVAWKNHLSDHRSWSGPVQYCVLKDVEGDIHGVFPTATQKIGPIKATSLAGPDAPYRCIPLATSAARNLAAFERISDYLTDENDAHLLRLGPLIPQDAEMITTALRDRGWRIYTKETQTELWQRLPNSYDEYLATVSKRSLKRLRQYKNKLEKSGNAEIKKYWKLKDDDWKSLIPELEHIEKNSPFGSHFLDDRFIEPEKQNFWKQFLNSSSEDCEPIVWVLYFNGEPISYNFVIDCGETRYGYSIAYHKDFARFRTGSILLQIDIKDAFESGIRYINWGAGKQEYKRKWGANIERTLIDLVAFKSNAQGVLLSQLFRLGRFVDTTYRKYRSRIYKLRKANRKSSRLTGSSGCAVTEFFIFSEEGVFALDCIVLHDLLQVGYF